MTCHYCRTACKRFGKHRNGLQRFRCNQCRKTFTEEHTRPLDEMRLPVDQAVRILQLLLGNDLPSDDNLKHTLILDWTPPF